MLTNLCQKISLKTTQKFVNTEQIALFTEKGKNNSFVGRAINYKPIVIKNSHENLLGKFKTVKITPTKSSYLPAKLLK